MQQRPRFPDFYSLAWVKLQSCWINSHNATLQYLFVICFLPGKYPHLSNSTPWACNADFVSKNVESPRPSHNNPDDITITSARVFLQTWQSSSKATEDIMHLFYWLCSTPYARVSWCMYVWPHVNGVCYYREGKNSNIQWHFKPQHRYRCYGFYSIQLLLDVWEKICFY